MAPLGTHIVTHHVVSEATKSVMKFKCVHCDMAYQHKALLRSHYISVHEGKVRCCNWCGAEYEVLKELEEHTKLKHRVQLDSSFSDACPDRLCNDNDRSSFLLHRTANTFATSATRSIVARMD